MSWDAYLEVVVDGHELEVGDWNYTHNCNGMIRRVLDVSGVDYRSARVGDFLTPDGAGGWVKHVQEPCGNWWDALSGQPATSPLLDTIVDGLLEAPALFRSMNPENGWGDYDSLLGVLVEMRDRARAFPSGRWRASG